jgi:hypothetical protein
MTDQVKNRIVTQSPQGGRLDIIGRRFHEGRHNVEINNHFHNTHLAGTSPDGVKDASISRTNHTQTDEPSGSGKEPVAPDFAPDPKEAATEMLPQARKMGEFKDQDWVEEAKNFQIGPDIRFAVKSDNPEFLQRIIWGPLTTAEFREITHKLRELEIKSAENPNILKGKIISEDQLKEGFSKPPPSRLSIKI